MFLFRRLFWLMVGAGFGFGLSFWLMRTVRNSVQRYAPKRLSDDAVRVARGISADVRAAVAEGREAMREREAELRRRANGKATGVAQARR